MLPCRFKPLDSVELEERTALINRELISLVWAHLVSHLQSSSASPYPILGNQQWDAREFLLHPHSFYTSESLLITRNTCVFFSL